MRIKMVFSGQPMSFATNQCHPGVGVDAAPIVSPLTPCLNPNTPIYSFSFSQLNLVIQAAISQRSTATAVPLLV